MAKPLIGLTTTRIHRRSNPLAFGANKPYSQSISDAGGLPVLIPSNVADDDLEGLLARLDGILFTGGYDIDPLQYGNPAHPKVAGIDADRDQLEIRLVKELIRLEKPFLGICRGFQVINVALGGSLYEDIAQQVPAALQHDNHDRPRDYLAHPVNVQAESRLAGILGEHPIRVNSLHHQGINRLAGQLVASAHAPDGLVEAVELPTHPFLIAVQWHPEELQEHPPMRKLFQEFINNCCPEKNTMRRLKG